MVLADNKKIKNYIIYSAIASLIFLSLPFTCYAFSLKDVVNGIMGFIASMVVSALGAVVSLIIKGIITVAPYNKFIQEPAITQAWGIVRDFSNMFFILILLVIAFATILRIESYNMKRWLPKLLIMAVLINFSKTICGVMIDFSQVIMLTFVNTFANSGGSFVDVGKIQEMVKAASVSSTQAVTAGSTAMDYGGTVVAYLLACVFMLVAAVAFFAILIAFVMRIIMLWILVALSPLAFMLSSFPQGQRFASQYWGEFTKYLINGPVLAFFIWLSLSVMNNFNKSTLYTSLRSDDLQVGASSIMTSSVFIPFVMAIGFLVGGLMISQQIGGIGAGWGMSTARNLGNKGMNVAKRGARGTFKGAVAGLDWVNRKQATRTGVDLNMSRNFQKVKASFARQKSTDLNTIEQKAHTNLQRGGMVGALTGFSSADWADNYISGFMGYKGIRQAFAGGAGKVKRLTDEQKEYDKMAEAAGDNSKYGKRMRELTKEQETAEANGDTKKVAEIKKTIALWESNKDKIVSSKKDEKLKGYDQQINNLSNQKNLAIANKAGKKEIERIEKELAKVKEERQNFSDKAYPGEKEAARAYFAGKSGDLRDSAGKLTMLDFYGKVADRSAISEEAKKVTSANEDELVNQFGVAVAHNNSALAAAIARALTKNGNMNALLGKYGYNAKAGLTEKEAQRAMKNGTYNQFKGVNDFMRDVFTKKLGMSGQSTLALQSDLSGIGEDIGHNYLMSTVGYDRTGHFYQREANERNEIKSIENAKKESENKVRKLNRFGWGDEDLDGNFTWDSAGLADFINNIALVDKEMKGNRFNRNAAGKISQNTKAMERLEKALREIYAPNAEGIVEVPGEKGDLIPIDDFLERFKRYGRTASDKERNKILHINVDTGDENI